MFRISRSASLCLVAAAAIVAACSKDKADDSQQQHIKDVVAAGGVVDSILPIPEQIRRFRDGLTDQPDTLRHASSSSEALVERWASAVATSDTAELNAMLIDRAEFAWLYYPDSRMSKPPYESPPQLLWGQLLASSNEGARGLLKNFGGKRFKVLKLLCTNQPTIEGENILHERCAARVQIGDTMPAEGVYFGSIVERDHRFKFLGYANKL